MKSHIIATTSLIAAACLIAATIAVPSFTSSAFAVANGNHGNTQSIGQSAQANNNGLAGIAAGVGVQAGDICVAALTGTGC
jgi:hypothetical protein